MVELQSYLVAGMGVFWGEYLGQRSPLPIGHLSEEKTELWVCWWFFYFFFFFFVLA